MAEWPWEARAEAWSRTVAGCPPPERCMVRAIPEILVTITIITVIVLIFHASFGTTDTGIRTTDIPGESGSAECYPIGAAHRIRILSSRILPMSILRLTIERVAGQTATGDQPAE